MSRRRPGEKYVLFFTEYCVKWPQQDNNSEREGTNTWLWYVISGWRAKIPMMAVIGRDKHANPESY